MRNTPIAVSTSKIRERLLVSLASLRQGDDASAAVKDIVSGLALANEALSRVEIGGSSALLFQARSALLATLHHLQDGTHDVHAVGLDISVLVTESLELLLDVIHEHSLLEPKQKQMVYEAAEQSQAVAPAVAVPPKEMVASDVESAIALPIPSVSVAQVKSIQDPSTPTCSSLESIPEMDTATRDVQLRPRATTVFPRTAVRLQFGSNGLPHIDVELDVHSESNFFTSFVGNIRDRGGVFVATWAAAAVGTSCGIKIHFPGDLSAEVRGVVRWRRESQGGESDAVPGLGVEIIQADEDAWALIQRFIDKREPIVHDM